MNNKINSIFAAIATKYDISNDILSLGIHRLWRKKAIKLSNIKTGKKVIDFCTGTGDFAIGFKKKVGLNGEVTGFDACKEMLDIAIIKAKNKGLDIKFEIDDAINSKYKANSFDLASVAFGIRNTTSIKDCLLEMSRLVSNSGRLIVLEFGQSYGLFSIIYNFYSKYILPYIGKLISKNYSAYNYLQDSSAKFPCKEKFISIMQEIECLKNCRYYSLTFGIAYIYIAEIKK